MVTQLSTRRRQTGTRETQIGKQWKAQCYQGSSGRRSPVIRISVYSQRVQD
jgi:hypothetical protein